MLRRIRNQLVAHLGGADRITRVQSLLIDRAAVLALRMEMLDADPCALMDERQGRQYLAYSNGYVRLLRELGIDGVPPPRASLDDLLARTREGVAA